MAVIFAEDVQVQDDPIDAHATDETLVVAGFPQTWSSGNGKAVIRAWCQLLMGAGTTGIKLTIHRGPTIDGPVVGDASQEFGVITPGEVAMGQVEVIDLLQNVGGAQYCLSVQQTGATGDGTVQAALIDTTILSG